MEDHEFWMWADKVVVDNMGSITVGYLPTKEIWRISLIPCLGEEIYIEDRFRHIAYKRAMSAYKLQVK